MASKRPPNRIEQTPSGLEIAYWDEVGVLGEPQQRRYTVQGERVPSVTTITGILDKPALLDWAAGLAREGRYWREVRDEAAKRGTSSHVLLNRVVTGQRASLGDLDDEHRAYGQAAFRWVAARRPRPLLAEQIVAAHEFAGRLDLVADLDGVRTLCDAKSVTKWSYKRRNGEETDELLPPYDENLLQLDLYQAALGFSGYEPAERGLIVRLGPDGQYDETSVELDAERGLAIFTAYRAKLAVGRELRRAAKAAREAIAA